MGSQERFLIALALIGTVGATLLAERLFSAPSPRVVRGEPRVVRGEMHFDMAELNQYPRGPLPLTHPGGWVTQYPSEALRAKLEGQVTTRLIVDAYGEVSSCEVVKSSGVAAFDKRTCAALVSNARFYPALDEDQQPVESESTQTVRYQFPD